MLAVHLYREEGSGSGRDASSRYRSQFREELDAVGGGLVGVFCSTIALNYGKRANNVCVPNPNPI